MSPPTITVLIVEDSLVNRELYRYCLLDDVGCDYSVLEAGTVAEGLALCQTDSIDGILLDYALPDGNGLEFLEKLALQSDRRPSVVMMTGHGDETIAVRAMKLGTEDYLTKHKFTPEILQSTMRSAIERKQSRRQSAQLELTRIHSEHDRFFNLSIDLLATIDFEGYFLRLNSAWEQTLGFNNTELMAQPFIDLVHPDDRVASIAAAQDVSTGALVANFENRYRCQDRRVVWPSGEVRWLSVRKQVFFVAASGENRSSLHNYS